jgi:hypothetical protein
VQDEGGFSVGAPLAEVDQLAVPLDDAQRAGIVHGQRAQQNRVHEAEDGGVGSDAECQRQRDDGRDGAAAPHRAQRKPHVLDQLF